MKNKFGTHYLIECIRCPAALLSKAEPVERMLLEAAEVAGAGVLGVNSQQFEPAGASGIVFLKESHMSVHTWPEAGYAAVDFFTCDDGLDVEAAIKVIERCLGPVELRKTVLPRGY